MASGEFPLSCQVLQPQLLVLLALPAATLLHTLKRSKLLKAVSLIINVV